MSCKVGIRNKYKRRFKECLQKITNNSEFIEHWKRLGLHQQGYHFDQIQPQHRDDIINILCYQFSCTGTTTTNPIFMNNITSKVPIFQSCVDWCIHTGLAYVVLNKYNKVCAVILYEDMADKNPNKYKITNKNELRSYEIDEYVFRHFDIWNAKIGNKINNKNVEMGEILHVLYSVVAPHLVRKGLGRVLSVVLTPMIGYKFHYSILVSRVSRQARTRKIASQWSFVDASKPFDFSTFVFEDGITMSSYYDKLQKDYGFSPSYVDKLRRNSIACVYIQDNTKINNASVEELIQVWNSQMSYNGKYVSKM
eukprot:550049_1